MADLKFVVINGETYDIPVANYNSPLSEIKAAAVKVDPSLANAEAVQEGDTVVFKFKAGTKGSN